MSNYKCIIVDDEPLARKLIAEHINELKELDLVGEFRSAIEAKNFASENQVDIIFLDINMPKLSGMDYLKNHHNDGLVIFTTAYPEFAVEAFEQNAFDYLLKPISFDRFLKSINKVKTHLDGQVSDKSQSITIKENKRLYKLPLDHILYIEAYGDYIKIHTADKVYTIKETLSHYEKVLDQDFRRIHRSFIIRMDKIKFVEGNQLSINNTKIPISSGYKESFMSRYQQ